MPKLFFPGGMGGVQNNSGNSGGGGGILVVEIGNSGEEGGLREIPSVVGVWIFSGTTHWHPLPNITPTDTIIMTYRPLIT